MDRSDVGGHLKSEDIRLNGAVCPHALKVEGHELSLHWLVELNTEWPPIPVGLFVLGITGDEVGLASRPEKGFPLDEEGSGVDFGLLYQPFVPVVIQYDITLRIVRKGDLLGFTNPYLEDSHH